MMIVASFSWVIHDCRLLSEFVRRDATVSARAAAAALISCRSMSAGPVRAESQAIAYGLLVSNQVCHDLSLTPFPHPPFLSLSQSGSRRVPPLVAAALPRPLLLLIFPTALRSH
jgi:hypothetical protein